MTPHDTALASLICERNDHPDAPACDGCYAMAAWLREHGYAHADTAVTIGPIQHANSMCRKDGCDCWCQACERHNWRHARADTADFHLFRSVDAEEACPTCRLPAWAHDPAQAVMRQWTIQPARADTAALDVEALIRNIEERIDRAAMGASVGQLSGSPVSEAVAWELGSLLVDVTENAGRCAAEDALHRAEASEQ